MTVAGWTLILVFVALAALIARPMGLYLAAVFDRRRKWLLPALDADADDFVSSHSASRSSWRVRVALRHRVQVQRGPPLDDDGRLSVDLARRIVKVNGVDPRFTPREHALLHELILHAGKVLTHRHLLTKACNQTEADVTALRVHIRHLRQKIEANPEQPERILTEPGVGYRLFVA